jgi:hypothetical protein
MPLPRAASVVPLVLVASLAAADAPRKRTVTGTYTSNWNDVTLVQEGSRIRGTYVCCGGGTIDGRIIEGRVIRYHWEQPGATGEGVWTVTPSGRLEGTWGFGQSADDGGAWNLAPKQSQGQIAIAR